MNKDLDRDIEHYISTAGLMEVLEISRSTVYRLMKKGMPSIMVGSVHRFPIDHVLKWLEENYGDATRE
jgi:excisionase family DNA binding protein